MWYRPLNESSLPTPALLVFPDRIEENIRRMVNIAGDPGRLRTHVKTHKTLELVQMQMRHGITKFKCATLAEMEMVATCGGKNILLAYPLLGPAMHRFFGIMESYPEAHLAVTVDSWEACNQLLEVANELDRKVSLFVDLDNGMHRTGIEPEMAGKFIEMIAGEEYFVLEGLHVYDGHIHDEDPKERELHCKKDFQSVQKLISSLEAAGIKIGELACGGTPTFPVHARHPDRTLCPGTPLLWDAGYADTFPDLDFLPAAVLAGRVISKPGGDICIDIGHKAVASEMPHPRIQFLDRRLLEVRNHNEEHMVVSVEGSSDLQIGDLVYALPVHICPTMALHEAVYVVRDQRIDGRWKVVARNRDYTPRI
jgi:D-serine deaminase-like pyridoxal phosphate-dependent protein